MLVSGIIFFIKTPGKKRNSEMTITFTETVRKYLPSNSNSAFSFGNWTEINYFGHFQSRPFSPPSDSDEIADAFCSRQLV